MANNIHIKNLLVMGINCFLLFGYLIAAKKFGRDKLSGFMNAAMFLLLMTLGLITLAYAGGMLFSAGLAKAVIASVVSHAPYALLLGASSSLTFTMIAIDFWQKPVVIMPNQAENIKQAMLQALSQNALLFSWIALNKYSLTNNFINITAPVITTVIFYQNFSQYLPVQLIPSLRVFFTKQSIIIPGLSRLIKSTKLAMTKSSKNILWIAAPHKQSAATNNNENSNLIDKYKYFWQSFSKNILHVVNEKAPYGKNKIFTTELMDLYNVKSDQAKIIGIENIIYKLRQHTADTKWPNVFGLILNFLQKFEPGIKVTSSQKMISGLINVFGQLISEYINGDSNALFILIKKIVATLLELNKQIQNSSSIDVYIKMYIYLAIQDIIKQLTNNALYAEQNIEKISELMSDLEHATHDQAKPDYFNINYASIIMNSGASRIPIIIKRPPDQKYHNEDCVMFAIENIKIANKTYQVTLAARMDIRLYELDYLDWKLGRDFKDISILDQNKAKVSSDECVQVLTFLKNLPKFLGKELTKLDAVAAEVFATTDDLIPALGKIQELIIVPVVNPNSDILTEDFLSNLHDAAQKHTPSQVRNIINNYKNILSKSTKHNNHAVLEMQIQKSNKIREFV